MRMRLMLSLITVCLLFVAGCQSTASGEGGGASNTNAAPENKPAEDTADNSAKKDPKEEPKEKPKEEEFCLLPPEAQDDELAGKIKVGQDAS